AAVCRELTKTYEEIRRGELAALVDWAGAGVRGEITIVVAGRPGAGSGDPPDPARLHALVAEREADGQSRKEAIAAVAAQVGQPKRVVYDAVVAAKRGAGPA
ncbi:MAG TPA: 16S rRNA (cytidine(1402)-2'-O)-methyltransferase, partial [Actinomycetes bacterium]|nr:16S rRNA (cytidine(1402)-2'-O)-methyltransferase [Actinomycetes bacterium]